MKKNDFFYEKRKCALLFFLFTVLIFSCSTKRSTEKVEPPDVEKIPETLTIHGDTRVDNYFWLNQRENPKVIDYLKAENEYKDKMMQHTEKLRDKLYKEIVGRIKQTDRSVPYLDNGYYYYYRYDKGEEYPIHTRKKESVDSEEEIMLNVPDMAKGYSFYQVRGLSVSSNNRYLAFGIDTVSRRRYTIHFKDLQTEKILSDKISNTSGSATWANDNKTIFYVVKDSTLRPHKVMRHILGTDPSQDVEIWHEKDNTFNTYVEKTKSDKYITIGSYSTLSTEMRILKADDPYGTFKVFQKREPDHEYSIYHFEDKFYVHTNWKAKNFRLMETGIVKTEKKHWREVIPQRKDVLLNEIDVFKDYLVISERKDGLRQIRVIGQRNSKDYYLNFDEDVYVTYASNNREFDTNILRFIYSSLTTPQTTYDYNMSTEEKKLLKQEEVVGKFNPSDYTAERLWATADDGTSIPVSLVYKKGISKDSQNPCLLYGYGSYGASRDPFFSSTRLSLLNRGFVYAIAHIRGGSEMGRYWYEDGKLLQKKNTFTDFIDCAEYLIEKKYTNPDKLFAMGGSAGGLLMGAVVNMRPDLFKGVLALVPWVDVVTTMLDESIPLTTSEFDEWGNPKNKEYYKYMLSYSPYDNVKAQDYPAMLVTTGLHDSQVQYFEPTKWVAKLRDMKTDDNCLIMDIDMESGHGGSSGRFKRYKRTALEYTFIFDQLGIQK